MAKQNQNNKKKTKNLPQKKQHKKKQKNRTMGIAGSPMGLVSLFFFGFFLGFLPKSLQIFFGWFNDFFNSLPGILPKEYQDIVVFLFV